MYRCGIGLVFAETVFGFFVSYEKGVSLFFELLFGEGAGADSKK